MIKIIFLQNYKRQIVESSKLSNNFNKFNSENVYIIFPSICLSTEKYEKNKVKYKCLNNPLD